MKEIYGHNCSQLYHETQKNIYNIKKKLINNNESQRKNITTTDTISPAHCLNDILAIVKNLQISQKRNFTKRINSNDFQSAFDNMAIKMYDKKL